MISVFHYQHYREFLRDFYNDEKRRRTGLTYARFSSAAGLRSPNYFKLVMDGQKNLTSSNIVKFSHALRLKEHETDYFEALVQFNQAKESMEREFYQQRMARLQKRGSSPERSLEEFEFESMSNWIYLAVMVMTHLRGFRESPAWIREKLSNLVSESEISVVLERLLQLKLLSRTAEGRLEQTYRQVRTRPDMRRLGVRLFYEGLLARAIQSFKFSEPVDREFSAYVVGLSPSQMPELRKRVREFMKSLNEWALENPKPHQIYAFTFAGFPLTASDKVVTK